MEIRHLITFKTIVEKGGFNKAAEHLGYAQSSITTHIKELERELGRPLFDRIGKKVILTQYGKEFLTYATEITELYNQSLTIDKEPQGVLTLGISESLTICRVPSILLQYKTSYPKVKLVLKSLENFDVTKSLKSGEIDIALLLEKDGWMQKELYSERLIREKMVLISSLNEGLSHTALYSELRCSYKSVFDEFIRTHNLDIRESIEFQSLEAIKQCVKYGLGVSLVPYFSVKEELEGNKLRGELFPQQHSSISTYLTYHKDKWLSPSMVRMIEIIKNHAKTWDC
ncbi:LysR family transcriptional regulator [Paenibacillus sp. EC2-1]|uniref:LysR family transcriptional regulator n=1 Tax=Paenibacillus sp. EC2-1 TaxID=3388665 RepID=UPI003BEEF5F9